MIERFIKYNYRHVGQKYELNENEKRSKYEYHALRLKNSDLLKGKNKSML